MSHYQYFLDDQYWSVLLGTPLKTTKEGNKQVDVFKAAKHSKALNYAWALGGTSLESENICSLIIWIRGIQEDTRIMYEAKKDTNSCMIYISESDFESQFKYCFLSGIIVYSNNGFTASFGGGPAGGRDEYWFEWSDPVKPSFYYILK